MTVSRFGAPQPWNPADATDIIREIANSEFTLHLTNHAREQMRERDLLVGDVTHVLKHGFVYDAAQQSTRERLYKYQIDGVTPNSANRTVGVVVLPSVVPKKVLKIINVMWRDEDR